MFCVGWGGGVISATLKKREAIQNGVRVVSTSPCAGVYLTRSCRLTAPPVPWPARQKPADVGQSLGLPEQLGVVNAEHQDRSTLVSLCTRVRIYCATVRQVHKQLNI